MNLADQVIQLSRERDILERKLIQAQIIILQYGIEMVGASKKVIDKAEVVRDNAKQDVVQVKNPRSGHYVKIDRRAGKIIDHKKSEGPYKNIPVVVHNPGQSLRFLAREA